MAATDTGDEKLACCQPLADSPLAVALASNMPVPAHSDTTWLPVSVATLYQRTPDTVPARVDSHLIPVVIAYDGPIVICEGGVLVLFQKDVLVVGVFVGDGVAVGSGAGVGTKPWASVLAKDWLKLAVLAAVSSS